MSRYWILPEASCCPGSPVTRFTSSGRRLTGLSFVPKGSRELLFEPPKSAKLNCSRLCSCQRRVPLDDSGKLRCPSGDMEERHRLAGRRRESGTNTRDLPCLDQISSESWTNPV